MIRDMNNNPTLIALREAMSQYNVSEYPQKKIQDLLKLLKKEDIAPLAKELFLHAAITGSEEVLAYLVEQGLIKDVNYSLDSATLVEMQLFWREEVIFYKRDGAAWSVPVEYRPTPLGTVIASKQYWLAARLLLWGADGKREAGLQPFLQRALIEAATWGDVDEVEALLEVGAQVNERAAMEMTAYDYEGPYTLEYNESALRAALKNGNTNTVACLLSYGADVKLEAWEALPEVLYVGIQSAEGAHKATAVAQMLLRYGASVEGSDEGGNTVLHIAVEKGNLGLVKLLIEAGCDPNAVNECGQRPLDIATRYKEPTRMGRRRKRIANYLQTL